MIVEGRVLFNLTSNFQPLYQGKLERLKWAMAIGHHTGNHNYLQRSLDPGLAPPNTPMAESETPTRPFREGKVGGKAGGKGEARLKGKLGRHEDAKVRKERFACGGCGDPCHFLGMQKTGFPEILPQKA